MPGRSALARARQRHRLRRWARPPVSDLERPSAGGTARRRTRRNWRRPPACRDRERVARAPAPRRCLLQGREGGSPQRHVPGKRGDALPRAELGVGIELRADGRAVAELEQVDDPPVAGLQRQLPIAGPVGQGEHLACDSQAFLASVRAPGDHVAGVERSGERRRVVDPPGKVQCLLAECVAPPRIGLVGELDRQPREQPHPKPGMFVADRRERLLERGDHLRRRRRGS